MREYSDVQSHFCNNLTDLCHVGYVVPDMDRAMRLWQVQGARVVIPPKIDPIQKVVCALLMLSGTAPIELVAPVPEEENHPLRARLKRGGGLDHLCFFSDNLEDDLAQYQATGAVLLMGPVYGCVFDRRLAFVHLRTGLVLELMDRLPQGQVERDPLEAVLG